MRISDWSSDVCSSDLMWITVGDVWRIRYRQIEARIAERAPPMTLPEIHDPLRARRVAPCNRQCRFRHVAERHIGLRPFDGDCQPDRAAASAEIGDMARLGFRQQFELPLDQQFRSEELTYEIQSLMRIPYTLLYLKKTIPHINT